MCGGWLSGTGTGTRKATRPLNWAVGAPVGLHSTPLAALNPAVPLRIKAFPLPTVRVVGWLRWYYAGTKLRCCDGAVRSHGTEPKGGRYSGNILRPTGLATSQQLYGVSTVPNQDDGGRPLTPFAHLTRLSLTGQPPVRGVVPAISLVGARTPSAQSMEEPPTGQYGLPNNASAEMKPLLRVLCPRAAATEDTLILCPGSSRMLAV